MIRTLINRSFFSNKLRNLIAIFAIALTTMMFTSLFLLSQSGSVKTTMFFIV